MDILNLENYLLVENCSVQLYQGLHTGSYGIVH